ncbi:MAG TPA: trypsin-like peptidase domain-containing protein [Candidatus Kapabacteria bacterium]|nr:trypsin-like peptidase domain-containing protein [Candidatus Kapabacteria bacterium]
MKKVVILSTLLVGTGMFIGILLVSNFSLSGISNIFAQDMKLGSSSAPVTPAQSVIALNQAMVNASEAILPTVVYIKVEAEIKGNSGEGQDGFDFFRFFAPKDQEKSWKTRGSGSGVIVSANGYIVTNNHVVENATEKGITIQTFDKKEYKATVVGKDEYTDLALLKIEATGLPVAHFADINTVKVGSIVLAVGNPIGLSHTVTQGIVSAIGRGSISQKKGLNIEHYIQTDAAINPGNSGGGLFDINGSLVGINTAIATENGGFMGYGFAIPIDLMQAVVSDLIDDGQISRGYIGVAIDEVDEVLAKGLNLPKVQGVLVQNLVENGAAKSAGIQSGDVILEIDGKEVNSPSELQSKIVFYRAGDKVDVTLWRNSKIIHKIVTLKSQDGNDISTVKGGSENDGENTPKANEPVNFDKLGFSVKSLTGDQKKEFSVEKGVLVSDVKRYSIAADRGLFPNCIIIEADGQAVRSTNDIKNIIDSKKDGEVVILNIKYKDRAQIVALQVSKS